MNVDDVDSRDRGMRRVFRLRGRCREARARVVRTSGASLRREIPWLGGGPWSRRSSYARSSLGTCRISCGSAEAGIRSGVHAPKSRASVGGSKVSSGGAVSRGRTQHTQSVQSGAHSPLGWSSSQSSAQTRSITPGKLVASTEARASRAATTNRRTVPVWHGRYLHAPDEPPPRRRRRAARNSRPTAEPLRPTPAFPRNSRCPKW